jgi:hypothetical protein
VNATERQLSPLAAFLPNPFGTFWAGVFYLLVVIWVILGQVPTGQVPSVIEEIVEVIQTITCR